MPQTQSQPPSEITTVSMESIRKILQQEGAQGRMIMELVKKATHSTRGKTKITKAKSSIAWIQ